ncbi:hypothetical protein BDZ45DRAFT_741686 [Acephala macrosclerotiorum]|nr:hypothetical protein BDZ45DRAFT_741686 [Acephala macrosclerotiorum]
MAPFHLTRPPYSVTLSTEALVSTPSTSRDRDLDRLYRDLSRSKDTTVFTAVTEEFHVPFEASPAHQLVSSSCLLTAGVIRYDESSEGSTNHTRPSGPELLGPHAGKSGRRAPMFSSLRRFLAAHTEGASPSGAGTPDDGGRDAEQNALGTIDRLHSRPPRSMNCVQGPYDMCTSCTAKIKTELHIVMGGGCTAALLAGSPSSEAR